VNKDKVDEVSEIQKAEAVSQAMKLIIGFNGFQLKELRRFVVTSSNTSAAGREGRRIT